MNDLKRKEEYFPSPSRMKQLKSCWMKKIKTLKELLEDLNVLSVKKGEVHSKLTGLDLVGSIGEVQDPKLMINYILLTMQQFEEHVEILKCLSIKRFKNMTKYTKQEIESWFVEYMN